jgi:purine-binding chemotaxis protein CheW
MEIRDLQEVNAELQEKKERQDSANFKMVTFSLSGKDYGVDIMNIKEIAKADKFTYVPNAAGYVRGVYNLRGDIIPIIDLRLFFHLPVGKINGDGQENMLIFHIEDRVYGTIVDKIDKVIGIHTKNIQPPHPIFGDINIKYISGVVEQQGDLYVILDVVRIFSPSQASLQNEGKHREEFYEKNRAPFDTEGQPSESQKSYSDNDLGFIKDGLGALKKFQASPMNEKWIQQRLEEWGRLRSTSNIQLKNTEDAEEFLSPFYSPCSGKFWDTNYADALKELLPDLSSNNIQVWNPGCGKGMETFSLACILKMRYPDGHIKIWANDNDIMLIANAPNLTFHAEELPEYCQPFLVKGRGGVTFNSTIKDSIVFEYHDVSHGNALPELDLVFCRDLLSFLPEQVQNNIIGEFGERLKKKGMVIVGAHEELPSDKWKNIGSNDIAAFIRV